MQCMASQLVNVCMNVLYHFGLKLEQVLFPVDRLLGLLYIWLYKYWELNNEFLSLSMPKVTNCMS